MPTIPGIGTSVLASDIIKRAAKAIGYLGRNDVMSAGDANDGLQCLNAMLDSWAGETLFSYATNTQSFALTVGKQQYTVGTVGTPDINNTRPTDISSAYLIDSNGLTYNVEVIPQDRWDAIGLKSITSQIPNTLFYDSQFPLGIINIFPVPLISYTLYYQAILQQAGFALLTTQLSMPPGYALGYIQNLAVQMMSAGFPCLLDADGKALLYENAAKARANIKRLNTKEVLTDYDDAIISQGSASYNIFTDR